MARRVSEHALSGLLGNSDEAIADGIFRPGIAALVSKDFGMS